MLGKVTIHFDGSCWPNPGGTPKYGWWAEEDGVEVARGAGELSLAGEARTNNSAEWGGLVAALKWAAQNSPIDSLSIKGDSQVVINQFLDYMKVKKPHLIQFKQLAELYYERIVAGHIEVIWVPREENSYADSLSR